MVVFGIYICLLTITKFDLKLQNKKKTKNTQRNYVVVHRVLRNRFTYFISTFLPGFFESHAESPQHTALALLYLLIANTALAILMLTYCNVMVDKFINKINKKQLASSDNHCYPSTSHCLFACNKIVE